MTMITASNPHDVTNELGFYRGTTTATDPEALRRLISHHGTSAASREACQIMLDGLSAPSFPKGTRLDLDTERPGTDVWEVTMPVNREHEETRNMILGRVGIRGQVLAFSDRNIKGVSVKQLERRIERGSAAVVDATAAPAAAKRREAATDGPAIRIRKALKAEMGLTSKQVSVKTRRGGGSINVTIKAAGVKLEDVKKIAAVEESVSRDGAGNLLRGGNTFVFVHMDDAVTARAEELILPWVESLPPEAGWCHSFPVSDDMRVSRSHENPLMMSLWGESHICYTNAHGIAGKLASILCQAGELDLDAFSVMADQMMTGTPDQMAAGQRIAGNRLMDDFDC